MEEDKKSSKVTIEWRTYRNEYCQLQVDKNDVQSEMDRIRSFPDVKVSTVKIAFQRPTP